MTKFPCRNCANHNQLVYVTAENLSEVTNVPTLDGGIKTWRYVCPVCGYYEDMFLPLGEENV